MGRHATRRPDRIGPQDDPAAEFLRLACLTYSADHPSRREAAAALLAARPDLGADDVYVRAACCDGPALRRLLAADPALADADGGPFGWAPLLYLVYARHAPDVTAPQVADAVAALLDAGADPNAGYLWDGNDPPFTALTGAFGEGEGGPDAQPRHPQWEVVARALLTAGADPNDGQTLYNRTFRPDDSHLRVLFEHGLDDAEDLAFQLSWAVAHGFDGRVELLLAHGVNADADVPGHYGVGARSPYALALISGHGGTAALLARLGASTALTDVDRVIGAVVNGGDIDPGHVAAAVAARPGLVPWLAKLGRRDAVARAVALGWDVNARGRTDVPSDQPWETGLHAAAGNNDAETVRSLLALGASPKVTDCRFDATPAQWARHFGHTELAAELD